LLKQSTVDIVRFEDVSEVLRKVQVFWGVISYHLVKCYWCFVGVYYLCLCGWAVQEESNTFVAVFSGAEEFLEVTRYHGCTWFWKRLL